METQNDINIRYPINQFSIRLECIEDHFSFPTEPIYTHKLFKIGDIIVVDKHSWETKKQVFTHSDCVKGQVLIINSTYFKVHKSCEKPKSNNINNYNKSQPTVNIIITEGNKYFNKGEIHTILKEKWENDNRTISLDPKNEINEARYIYKTQCKLYTKGQKNIDTSKYINIEVVNSLNRTIFDGEIYKVLKSDWESSDSHIRIIPKKEKDIDHKGYRYLKDRFKVKETIAIKVLTSKFMRVQYQGIYTVYKDHWYNNDTHITLIQDDPIYTTIPKSDCEVYNKGEEIHRQLEKQINFTSNYGMTVQIPKSLPAMQDAIDFQDFIKGETWNSIGISNGRFSSGYMPPPLKKESIEEFNKSVEEISRYYNSNNLVEPKFSGGLKEQIENYDLNKSILGNDYYLISTPRQTGRTKLMESLKQLYLKSKSEVTNITIPKKSKLKKEIIVHSMNNVKL